MDNNMREFLFELTELSRKHKLIVTACGCCGGPWISGCEEAAHPIGHYRTLPNGSELEWLIPGDPGYDDKGEPC
jgi:hypothetical protein